jgi:uncharacterized membrane protein YphA (DoxX/SURF4 family)
LARRQPQLPEDAPLAESSYRPGWLAIAAIVALRLVLGLHFFVEGYTKLTDAKPFSAPFLSSARGPLAAPFKAMVWDADGLYRLDSKGTLAHWDRYRTRITRHYGFDEGQIKDADQVLKTYKDRLSAFVRGKSEEIQEYYKWIDRRTANAKDPARQLASLQTHDARIQTETKKLYGEVIPTIDRLWQDLENDLNAIATEAQWKRHGRLEIGKIGRRFGDSETLDWLMPYFDLGVGICLLIGLLTRPAAILAAGFLATVFLSHFPPEPGPASTYYHLVELFALLAIAAIGAGRFLGIDYFFGGLKAWCCPGKGARETK